MSKHTAVSAALLARYRSSGRSHHVWCTVLAVARLVSAVLLALVAIPRPAFAAEELLPEGVGYDISWPDCRRSEPTPPLGTAIIGVTGGRAFSHNPCFPDQYRRAVERGDAPLFYVNADFVAAAAATRGRSGPRGTCDARDTLCQAYNYGYNTLADADGYARSIGATARMWWIDVETANHWSRDTSVNAQVLQGAIDYVRSRGLPVGVYSIAPMWRRIAGGFAPGVPNWVAETDRSVPTLSYCSPRYAFGGGSVWMVQHWDGVRDADYVCPGVSLGRSVAAGSSTLGASLTGSLAGSPGGAFRDYTFDYPGNDTRQTITVTFWPHGPDTANGFYVSLYLDGTQVAKVVGTDTPTPGQLHLTLTSPASGTARIQIANYNDPTRTPPIGYSIQRDPS